MWQCPLCHEPLDTSHSPWHCKNRHSFDRARSGYVNLLPVQNKKSKHPGDDRTMLEARRDFHAHKGYAPLKQAMVELLQPYLKDRTDCIIYDAGCGEGSYLNYCVTALNETGVACRGAGSDIAKLAVEMAAKAFKHCQFVVASSHQLPVISHSLDVCMQVFAPGKTQEYARVLKSDGLLITVDPGPAHLWEIKQAIYAQPRQHEQPTQTREGFSLVAQQPVTYNLNFVDDAQQQALLKMTPFYWRLEPGKLATLCEQLTAVTVDFVIQLWQVETPVHEQ